jgi:hypothetical protein
MKTCIRCGIEQSIDEFRKQKETKDGHANQCRLCLNEIQRIKRKGNGNEITHKYEKTIKGFLMREYRNMESRVTGVQKQKAHLYLGLPLLDRDQFYSWALCQRPFHVLFAIWEESMYERKLTPTVDRIDSSKGYEIGNMEWVTHSENSRRGSVSRNLQYYGHSLFANCK